MTSVAHALGEFIAAWNAGERPRLDDYISRVAPDEQDDLAQQIRMYMLTAPEPEEYSEEAWAEMSADPMIARIAEQAMEPEPWPSLLPRLRERAGLTAAAVVDRLGTRNRAKAQNLYEEMESGELDPERPSWALLDKLAGIFGVSRESLDWRGGGLQVLRSMAAPPPAAAPALFRSDDAVTHHDMDLLADGLTQQADDWDDVDDLFLGGR